MASTIRMIDADQKVTGEMASSSTCICPGTPHGLKCLRNGNNCVTAQQPVKFIFQDGKEVVVSRGDISTASPKIVANLNTLDGFPGNLINCLGYPAWVGDVFAKYMELLLSDVEDDEILCEVFLTAIQTGGFERGLCFPVLGAVLFDFFVEFEFSAWKDLLDFSHEKDGLASLKAMRSAWDEVLSRESEEEALAKEYERKAVWSRLRVMDQGMIIGRLVWMRRNPLAHDEDQDTLASMERDLREDTDMEAMEGWRYTHCAEHSREMIRQWSAVDGDLGRRARLQQIVDNLEPTALHHNDISDDSDEEMSDDDDAFNDAISGAITDTITDAIPEEFASRAHAVGRHHRPQ